jgi:hypothetical protein
VPDLLKRVSEGLKVAGIEDAVRSRFFVDLRKLHSEIIDKGRRARSAVVPDAERAPPQPVPDIVLIADPPPAMPEAIQPAAIPAEPPPPPSEAEMAKPEAPEFTPAITVNNPFGEGEVQVDDLDFTVPVQSTADAKRVAQGVDRAELPGNLKEGTRVKIRGKGEKDMVQPATLSYISPLRTRYLFVDRQGKTVLECSATVLAKLLSDGEIVIEEPVEEVPLFDRIMGGVVGKLKTPAKQSGAKIAK